MCVFDMYFDAIFFYYHSVNRKVTREVISIKAVANNLIVDAVFSIWTTSLQYQYQSVLYVYIIWLQYVVAFYCCTILLHYIAALYCCRILLHYIAALYSCIILLPYIAALYCCIVADLGFVGLHHNSYLFFMWKNSLVSSILSAIKSKSGHIWSGYSINMILGWCWS